MVGGVEVTITYFPQLLGTHTSTLTIDTNDASRQKYHILLKGNAVSQREQNTAVNCSICNSPPPKKCIDNTRLRTFSEQGTCERQACVYKEILYQCEIACDQTNHKCIDDPCYNIQCDNPPNNCYKSDGTCINGACQYAFNDNITCNDDNPCTENDICTNGVCRGQTIDCGSPPNECFDNDGQCINGVCHWNPRSDNICNTGDFCAPT